MKNRFGAWLMGMLFPVSSFSYAITHPDTRSLRLQVVLFFSFVGLAMFYEGEGRDVYRYVVEFEDAYAIRDVGFWQYFQSIPETNQIDYYSAFIRWLVSRFTGNPKIFLGILAFIMSLFFAANVEYIVRNVTFRKESVLLFCAMILVPRLFFVTHRWYTALQIFLYGALPVLYEKKYWRLIWCAVAAFVVHFSFLYPLLLVFISVVIPNKRVWPYVMLYVLAFLMNSFNFDGLVPYLERFLPTSTFDRTIQYMNEGEFEQNFFSQSARILVGYANLFAILCIGLGKNREWMRDESLRRFFTSTLLFAAFSSVASLTEWGWRYLDLSNYLIFAFYVLYFSAKERGASIDVKPLRLILPVIVYFILFQIRGFMSCIGPKQFFAGNYLTAWFLNDEYSMLDLIKNIL